MPTQDEKLRMLIAEQAAEWHVAQLEGELDSQQARAFMQWLRTSPMHIVEYLTIAGIARDASDAARKSKTPLQPLLLEANKLDQVVPFDEARHQNRFETSSPHAHRIMSKPQSARHAGRRLPVVRWVAAFAVVALVLTVMLVGIRWFAPRPQIHTFSTRHGEQRSLQLPDDTVVQLDSDSSISVQFDHRQRRVDVERGQAYFRVAKDSGRPFSVRVGRSLIRDVGTAFNIYRHPTDTTVTVAQGRVQVWAVPGKRSGNWFGLGEQHIQPHGKPLADLVAGYQVRITRSGNVESQGKIDVQQVLAWTRGDIAFDNQSVASVAAEFNRYNRQQIDVADPRIGALLISGVFNAHDVGTFTAFLGTMHGVHVETHGQRIIVSASQASRARHE